MPGSYEQYCPIAQGLDVLGDRWTLLVIRELSLGAQRFTDLRANLPGIPPNVLSQRLKKLAEHGLVTTRELPPPAARTVYELTPRGRETQPILRALVRFGITDLEPAAPGRELPARRAAITMFLPWFDPAEAARLAADEHYDVIVDGETYHLSASEPKTPHTVNSPPAATLTGNSWAFTRLRQDKPLDTLLKESHLTLTGSAPARRRFRKVYALP